MHKFKINKEALTFDDADILEALGFYPKDHAEFITGCLLHVFDTVPEDSPIRDSDIKLLEKNFEFGMSSMIKNVYDL